MKTLGSLVFCFFCFFCVWTRAQESVRGRAEPWGELRVAVIDLDTDQHIAARCYLSDPTRQFWSPPGALNYVKPPERHFIAPGEFRISLPPRVYTLTVERGPEYRPVTLEIEIHSGERREVKVALARWIDMNARGWYSGDLHNHRDWQEMPQLLLAEDLNLAPTLTEWIFDGRPASRAPASRAGTPGAVRRVDRTHAYSVFDTEIERLHEGPGALDLLALKSPVKFDGYLLGPPDSTFAALAHHQGGYVDAEKITWRDAAALVALGHVDFAGLVYNHFNRHGVELETDAWGMIPKEKPEYRTPAGMPLWAMDVYYRLLNCGFRLPVSAGSASGVKASPLGFNRVYVHIVGEFGYGEWFRALKAGRSFATNGPMLFMTVNGHELGETILVPAAGGPAARRLKVDAKASSARSLDRLEIVWKGRVIRTVSAGETMTLTLTAEVELDATETGWLTARAFEKPGEVVRFAHTSPVYVRIGNDDGIVPEDAKFFLNWIDREMNFYMTLPGFRSDADRQAMLGLFERARRVYARLASGK